MCDVSGAVCQDTARLLVKLPGGSCVYVSIRDFSFAGEELDSAFVVSAEKQAEQDGRAGGAVDVVQQDAGRAVCLSIGVCERRGNVAEVAVAVDRCAAGCACGRSWGEVRRDHRSSLEARVGDDAAVVKLGARVKTRVAPSTKQLQHAHITNPPAVPPC